jgi:hypothetical protein
MAEEQQQQQQGDQGGQAAKQGSLLTGGEGGGDPVQTWADSFDPETKGWIESKGLTKLAADKALPELAKGWRGAESKLGVPAEQLVRMPKDENDAEGLKAYLGKLGVPETPEGYEIKQEQGIDTDFPTQAAKWFYEMNVPKNIAKGLYSKLKTYAESTANAAEEQFNQQADTEITSLKSEWKGGEFDKNVELARRVRATMGLSDEETMAVERAIGVGRAAKVFSSLGKALGEHRFHGGDQAQTRFSMSPEAARSRILEVQADPKWMESYMAGDADKNAEFKRLHEIGFPQPQAA